MGIDLWHFALPLYFRRNERRRGFFPSMKGMDDGEEDGYFAELVDPRFLYNTNFHDI